MVRVLGEEACRATQRARGWMGERGVSYQFMDITSCRLEKSLIGGWIDAYGWQMLIDKRTSAWRTLPADLRQTLDTDRCLALLQQRPLLLKKPLIRVGPIHLVGWNASNKIRLLGQMQIDASSNKIYRLTSDVAAQGNLH